MVLHRQREQSTGLALLESASVARLAVVGVGVGGTLTLSRLAERADSSWRGTTLDIVDRPESLGRGRAFGSDIATAAVNTSAHRLEALSPSLSSFSAWHAGLGGRSTDLDDVPMSRSVYGDYLTTTLAKAIDRLRSFGVGVRLHPMHATAVRPQDGGVTVVGDTAELPPADIAVVAPGVWSPNVIQRESVSAYPLSGLRTRLGDRRSVAVLGSGLTAVDIACTLDDGETRVHLLSRTGTLPRVQVEAARTGDVPRYLTEETVEAHAAVSDLTAGSVLDMLDRELARFGRSRTDAFSDAAHADHWADPLADPADLACYHTLSATNHALNTAFALLSNAERRTLRDALGPRWFRYRVRVPFSRWRQLSRMQAEGRLVVHGGVDARQAGLDDVIADLGADRLIPALGQSSTLAEGPELVAGLAAHIGCDDAGQGLVDPATGRALSPDGTPRDDLLLVGQVSAGSYFTVSALDVVAEQASRAAQTVADLINTRTSLRMAAAEQAA